MSVCFYAQVAALGRQSSAFLTASGDNDHEGFRELFASVRNAARYTNSVGMPPPAPPPHAGAAAGAVRTRSAVHTPFAQPGNSNNNSCAGSDDRDALMRALEALARARPSLGLAQASGLLRDRRLLFRVSPGQEALAAFFSEKNCGRKVMYKVRSTR